MPTASVPLSGGGQGISGRGNQRLAWNYSLPLISPWGTFGAGRLEVIPLEHWEQVVGHSQVASALVPLSRTYYHLLSISYLHTFVSLAGEGALSYSSVFLTGPSWEPLVPSVEFNGCVCRCAIFVSSLFSGVGFYGLICESGIHSFSEREMGSTWLVPSHQKADEKVLCRAGWLPVTSWHIGKILFSNLDLTLVPYLKCCSTHIHLIAVGF